MQYLYLYIGSWIILLDILTVLKQTTHNVDNTQVIQNSAYPRWLLVWNLFTFSFHLSLYCSDGSFVSLHFSFSTAEAYDPSTYMPYAKKTYTRTWRHRVSLGKIGFGWRNYGNLNVRCENFSVRGLGRESFPSTFFQRSPSARSTFLYSACCESVDVFLFHFWKSRRAEYLQQLLWGPCQRALCGDTRIDYPCQC